MKKLQKIISASVALLFVATMFSSCEFKSKNIKEPEKAFVKTDLHDAMFSFTYAELKPVFAPDNLDKLASLFEGDDELKDDTEIELNYNDISTRYYNDNIEIFNGIMGLLSDEEKAQLADNSDEVLKYFNTQYQLVKTECPVTTAKEDFWIDDDSIKFSDNDSEKLKNAAVLYKDFVEKGLKDDFFKANFNKDKTEKGENLNNIVYLLGNDKVSLLTPDDVVSVISSVTPTTEKDSNDQKIPISYKRTVVITLKNDAECVSHAFSGHSKEAVLDELKKAQDYFTVSDYSISYDAPTITATFDAVTDKILTVDYYNNKIIDSSVTGVGSLSYLGNQNVCFHCTDNVSYTFDWDAE